MEKLTNKEFVPGLVSVIIPAYNAERYVEECIQSALAQTYSSYEIMLMDDGSTDKTSDICQSYADKYPDRIRFSSHRNIGTASTRNKAIQLSRGEFIGFLDCDDLWLPEKLKKQVAFLRNDPNLGFVFSETLVIDSDGQIQGHWKRNNRAETFASLYNENFIYTLTVLVRRQCFYEVDLGDPTLFISEDYDLWLRLAKRFAFKGIPEPLAKYRLHAGNKSKDLVTRLKNQILILNKKEIARDMGFFCRRIRTAKAYCRYGEWMLNENDEINAGKSYLMAVLHCPVIGAYYWPKETEHMKFSLPYRIFKVYWDGLRFVLRNIGKRTGGI